MSTQRIIYPNEHGGVCLVCPAPDFTIEEVLKDVPSGKPFLVVNVSELPADITFFDAWTADFTGAPVKE